VVSRTRMSPPSALSDPLGAMARHTHHSVLTRLCAAFQAEAQKLLVEKCSELELEIVMLSIIVASYVVYLSNHTCCDKLPVRRLGK
jgi:hypothetical protein